MLSGAWFGGKEMHSYRAAGSDPVDRSKERMTLDLGRGAGAGVSLLCRPREGVPGPGRKWSLPVHP